MSRRDRFFFEKVLVSSNSFSVQPDILINIIDNESLLFINEGTGAVEISDQLVLAVQKFGGGTDSFVGSISWKEFT
jgi:hypothetical protein